LKQKAEAAKMRKTTEKLQAYKNTTFALANNEKAEKAQRQIAAEGQRGKSAYHTPPN